MTRLPPIEPAGLSRAGVSRRAALARDLTAALAILALALLAVLGTAGLPAPMLRALARRWNADRDYIIAARAVLFRFPFKIVVERPRVYRRGTVGPPVMEAGRISLSVRPLQWRLRRTGIRRILVEDGTVRRLAGIEEPDRVKAWSLPEGERGRLEWRRLTVTGLKMDKGSLDYRVKNGRVWLDDCVALPEADGSAGKLEGSGVLHLATRAFEGRVTGAFDPRRLGNLALAWGHDPGGIPESLDFPAGPPVWRAAFKGRVKADGSVFEADGDLGVEGFFFRGNHFRAARADGRVLYGPEVSRLEISQAAIVAGGGVIAGGLDCDFRAGTVGMDLNGTTSPFLPAGWMGIGVPEWMREIRFEDAARWRAQGSYDYRGRKDSDLRFHCEGRRVELRGISAADIELEARYDGANFTMDPVRAGILGGTASGSLSIAFREEPAAAPRYRLEARAEQLEFRGLIEAVTGRTDADFYEGDLSTFFWAEGRAQTDWLEGLASAGSLRIRRGRLLRLPLFGGLSTIMSRIIPGLDVVLMQTSARADFALENGRLVLRDARVEGDVLTLEGRGAYTLGGNLDFHVQIKLMRDQTILGTAVRAITFPISKLFEFRLRGVLDKPRWYPVNFSSDLLERLRGLID